MLVGPRLGFVGLSRCPAVPQFVLFGTSQEFVCESTRRHTGIVSALKVIGLSSGFTESIKVFLVIVVVVVVFEIQLVRNPSKKVVRNSMHSMEINIDSAQAT